MAIMWWEEKNNNTRSSGYLQIGDKFIEIWNQLKCDREGNGRGLAGIFSKQ